MVRFFLTLAFTWSISSWIMTETFFFFPSLKPIFASIEEIMTIPRHDKWNFSRIEEESGWLATELSQSEGGKKVARAFSVDPDHFVRTTLASDSRNDFVFEIREIGFDYSMAESAYGFGQAYVWWGT